VLLGREEERLALDRLLAEARDGRSGVLALVGEAGIGKTALLGYAAGRAEGMRVLRARGVESEAEIPFAGLAELLRPALGALDSIPRRQAAALASALGARAAERAGSVRDRRGDAEPAHGMCGRAAAAPRRRRRAPAGRLERRGTALRRAPAAGRSDRTRARCARGRALAPRRQ
jgi:hypothetical protein